MANKRGGEEERSAQAELGDEDWQWARHKSLLKEAISEWVAENPSDGQTMITKAMKAYLEELIDTQLKNVGTWTLRGIWALIIGALLYLWWKTVGFKV